jgi:1-acyl-sn-glycerol-3-phosphate acyltransferase
VLPERGVDSLSMQATQSASTPWSNGRRADPREPVDPVAAPHDPPAGIVERVIRALAARPRERMPAADLDERDPDYIRDSLPRLWLLASLWFRAEIRGLGSIPATGPVLLVGNHSGGTLTPDTSVFTLAFCTYFGVERRLYQLVDDVAPSMPGLGGLRRFGRVAASSQNAERALRSGAAVLMYPGGHREAHRPSWEAGTVDLAGSRSFVQLALEHDVPLVPVVAIGGQETALFLSSGERLARLLRLDRLLRIDALPISLALPWGLGVGGAVGHVPLPAKITIEVLPAIDLRERFGPEPDVDGVYDHVSHAMQETLDALAAERRLPILG